jgi:hypothetical protein
LRAVASGGKPSITISTPLFGSALAFKPVSCVFGATRPATAQRAAPKETALDAIIEHSGSVDDVVKFLHALLGQ